MSKLHKYELTHNKGQHIIYSDHYVWKCVDCGKELAARDKIMPRGESCKPIRIKIKKS